MGTLKKFGCKFEKNCCDCEGNLVLFQTYLTNMSGWAK